MASVITAERFTGQAKFSSRKVNYHKNRRNCAAGLAGSFLVLLVSVTNCPAIFAATLTSKLFGRTPSGQTVHRYTMRSASGVSVSFMEYGGTILNVTAPDRYGHLAPIVLGFPTLEDYETVDAQSELYFGALLGRYANWINHGQFVLDGRPYQITLSNPPQTIHGGKVGFDKRLWKIDPSVRSGKKVSAALSYTSADREEGFPGKLNVHVLYSLTDDGTFTISYEATTDAPTVVNLTSHMNFNLHGAGSGDVLQQVLTVNAASYLPVNQEQIPLGPPAPVAGTPFDFQNGMAIGQHIHDPNQQLQIAHGYDQYWILNKPENAILPTQAVHAYDPLSGRTIDCLTTEPGIGIYTAGWFTGPYAGSAVNTGNTEHSPLRRSIIRTASIIQAIRLLFCDRGRHFTARQFSTLESAKWPRVGETFKKIISLRRRST